MKTVSKNDRLRQFGRVTTLALVAGAPLIGTLAPADAQLGGYGNRRDQEQYQNRNDWNDRRTLTGRVTRDFSGDNFLMQRDNGGVVRVDARGDEPRRLSRGDRVEVTGRFTSNDRDRFRADSVRILDNRGNNGRNDRDLITREGTVTEDMSGDRFRMRLDNSRREIVVVLPRTDEPRRLSLRDRVEVTGRFSDNREDTFIARDVRILNNRGNGGGNNWNDRRTLTGVVTRDFSGDNFLMSSDNGRTVRVDARGDEPRRLSRGDRVEVTGRFTSNDRDRFSADSVRLIRNR